MRSRAEARQAIQPRALRGVTRANEFVAAEAATTKRSHRAKFVAAASAAATPSRPCNPAPSAGLHCYHAPPRVPNAVRSHPRHALRITDEHACDADP
jgi:hypothetical protein